MPNDKSKFGVFGEVLGFGSAMIIFTTILYYVLLEPHVLPMLHALYNFSYIQVVSGVISLYVVLLILRRALK